MGNQFSKKTPKHIFSQGGLPVPRRYDERTIISLLDSTSVIPVPASYTEAVGILNSIGEDDKRILLFPNHFSSPADVINKRVKSLDWLMKLDAAPVRSFIANTHVPSSFTREFLEEHRSTPQHIGEIASRKLIDPENPSVGAYWIGNDKRARAWTWLRCTEAAEMEVMQKKKGQGVETESLDKTPYGNNLRVRVPSRSNPDTSYSIGLSRLPMEKPGDQAIYSSWLNMSHNSPDPDAHYEGSAHNKREHPTVFWSGPAVFAFNEAMRFLRGIKHPRTIKINPFPIPLPATMKAINILRNQSLVINRESDGSFKLDTFYKTPIERILGAKTKIDSYEKCWFHQGRRNLDYLLPKNN